MSSEVGKELATESLLSPRPALARRIYVGRLSCGCAVAATIDPDDVAEMARNGYAIETVNAESVQIAGCQCTPVTPPREVVLDKLAAGEPRCRCTHGYYSHYLCSIPSHSRCLTNCGCKCFPRR